MADLVYVVLTILFLAATRGFIVACEQLMGNKK